MNSQRTSLNPRLILALGLCLLLAAVSLTAIRAQEEPTGEQLLAELEAATAGKITSRTSSATGNVIMVRATGDAVLMSADPAVAPADRAFQFLDSYGAIMGITDTQAELVVDEVISDDLGMQHVRMNQVYLGVPVFGAQVVVHMNDAGILSINGTYLPDVSVETTPVLSAADAQQLAVNAVSKDDPSATAQAPNLYIYDTGLLQRRQGERALAYAVPVHAETLDEQVWVDAHTGLVLNRISSREEGLHRVIYSPEFDPDNPEANVVREEGDPPTLVPPFDNLYDFAGQVYDMFFNAFGRDSYDGQGHVMRSVYLVNDVCPNAYWNGQTTNYCPGFDLDDVVAHEWGHAYTEYTHGLIYQWQSGALNESYSDIWGETLDLHNGQDGIGGSNNDEPFPNGQRWEVGEDLTEAVIILLLRDMWDPERLGYPAKVSSSNYSCSTSDNGGVHHNSGVPNHAFAMLVDGKSFNGQSVEGIGFNKAVQIYWRAGSVYQGPSTGFPEHADALEASCQDLVGTEVPDFLTGAPSGETITQADCDQVASTMLAVEMRQEPLQCNFQPILDSNTPPMCETPSYLVNEDWESGMDGWTLTSERADAPSGDAWPNYNWELASSLPSERAGSGVFAIDEITGTCAPGGDISGHFTINSPLFTVPDPLNDLELRFDHWVATETGWDGGNLKASINGAAFAVVPESAIVFNPYNMTLNDDLVDGNTNPLAGEPAWSGSNPNEQGGSWGTTIVDLTALGVAPGDTVQLRWDFGVDGCNGNVGWYLDNVNVFTCDGTIEPTPTPQPTPTSEPEPTFEAETTGSGWLVALDGTKINFGFQAEDSGSGPSGSLRLNDKAEDGIKLDITQITSVGPISGDCGGIVAGDNGDNIDNTLELTGTGTSDGNPVEIRACVEDNGNPGKGNDRFYLTCTSGCTYNTGSRAVDATIDAGNIQVAQSGATDGGSTSTEAGVLILDPLLLSDGLLGALQTFEVTVYDQQHNVMPNASVTLTRVAANGATSTFTAVSDLTGVAIFTVTNLTQPAEYTAASGALGSNAIALDPVLQ